MSSKFIYQKCMLTDFGSRDGRDTSFREDSETRGGAQIDWSGAN